MPFPGTALGAHWRVSHLPDDILELTRDANGDIRIKEKTSGEEVIVLRRTGANAYTLYNNTVAGGKVIQDSSLKNVANGIAGLDANVLLAPSQQYPIVEEYANHLGATDNFTQTLTSTGTATADATNHKMDLVSGNGVNSYASFSSKKTWQLGNKPVVVNILVQGLADGTGSNKNTLIGLVDAMTAAFSDGAYFQENTGNQWTTRTVLAGMPTFNNIAALANGDLLTIVATSSAVSFYKNGTLLFTHTTNLPAVALYAGALVECNTAAGTSRTASVDLLSVKGYK